jgi:hypothetical protein
VKATIRGFAIAALVGMALTTASLLVTRPISGDGQPGALRGAPAAYLVDPAGAELGPADTDALIIPDQPVIGPVYALPAAYDWLVWSFVALLVLGAYSLARRIFHQQDAAVTAASRS